jgi:hypothetical protein
MKCYPKMFIFVMLALIASFLPKPASSRSFEEAQQAKQAKPAAQQEEAQEADLGYTDEEYEAYEKATQETDIQKRATMLLGFLNKYPKSKLMPHIEGAYKTLLYDLSNSKKYNLLEPLAEQWLKLHPNDAQTLAYIAAAAGELGHDQRCVECLEEIFASQQSGTLAYEILARYKKINNQAKVTEWSEKLFKMPEYEGDYNLRAYFVKKYADAKNMPKAAEYASLTIKSIEAVKNPDAKAQEEIRALRKACHDLIGRNLYEQDKYADAIKEFQQAQKSEKYGEGYFYIGMSYRKLDKVDPEAIDAYAKSELLGGETKQKAKDNLEQVYKALHNQTLIGIEKVYKRAKEQLNQE